MSTGTPLDLTPLGGIFEAIGVLYLGAMAAVVGVVLWMPARWVFKLPIALLVVAGFVAPVLLKSQRNQQQWDEHNASLAASMAIFEERCKSAGEKIHRTVENVDGVVWMKWRPDSANLDYQYKMDDPYGRDCGGKDCIAQLLRVISGADLEPLAAERNRGGYRFVESIDPMDGKHYRYTAVIKAVRQRTPEERVQATRNNRGVDPGPDIHGFALERELIESYSARYGITWDDISTHEDRQHWIAGGSIKVVDLKTDEVIAERVGYMIDRGQGSRAGFRAPWSFAEYTACPAFDISESKSPIKASRSRFFVNRVLKP